MPSNENPQQHSPCTKGIISHFERMTRITTEGLSEDVRLTNERMLLQEDRLRSIETAQGVANSTLATILSRLDMLAAAAPGPPNGDNSRNYTADSEDDNVVNYDNDRDHRRLRFNRQGMRRDPPRHEVRDRADIFSKVKFNMPSFEGKYDPDGYLSWELLVDQKFACHDFPEDRRVRAATSEFTDFSSVWWREHCRLHPNNIPTTWEALKLIMRHRFVPSYYARDLLNKLQRLRQGTSSVEEYYQELQVGMLRCGLVEDEEASLARFLGGLNREIQDILDYKEYNSMTRLFHLACKAEREVQGRQSRTKTNFSAGRTTSWTPPTSAVPSTRTTTPSSSINKPASSTSISAPRTPTPTKSATQASTRSSSSSVASTGRTKDTQCHRCKGFGHMMRECPSKRVLIIHEDGEYDSASDLDEDTYALLAEREDGKPNSEHEEEHVCASDADQYLSIITQCVLSN